MRALLSSRQISESSEGSTSALRSSAPPATKRTIASATSSLTSAPPGLRTASSACAPVMRARRMRFCVIEGICAFEAFEVGEIVLAQCDQDAVVAAREVEALDDRFVVVELGFERARQPVLDQVGQIVDEARGALSARVVALARE